MKRLFTTIVISLVCLTTVWAQKAVVWEQPMAAYSQVSGRLDVSRVVFADTATIVTFHVNMPYTARIDFPSGSTLRAEGKDYKVKGIRDYALDADITMPPTGVMDIDLVFEPLPSGVKSLAFNMPDAFSINGIRDRYAQREGIADTYWRDEKTGDWMMGVGRNHVVYDCKVWVITSQTERKGAYTLNASNGGENITINIGKETKGLRTVGVGKEKTVCSMITGDFLPDYPTKDTATKLADNGYRMGDSVTIIGWYKDMTQEMQQMGSEFNAAYQSIFTDENKNFYTKMDSLGRFTLRMPVENAQMLYCDWDRTTLMFLVEPGETYFLMKDFATNKTLVMGRNARLQNELLAHKVSHRSGNYQEVRRMGGIMKYMAHCDSLMNDALAKLDTECTKYPTLSARYEKQKRQEIIADAGCSLMQARFSVKGFRLPEEYVDFVAANCWNKLEEPYTALGNDYTTFFRDYCDHKNGCLPDDEFVYGMLKAEKDGKIKLDDADKALIKEYSAAVGDFVRRVNGAPDSLRQQMAYEFNNSDVVKQTDRLIQRESIKDLFFISSSGLYEKLLATADSLGLSRTQRDIFLSTTLYRDIDNNRKPLQPLALEFIDENIRLEAARQVVREYNDKYEAINNQTLSTDNLKPADDVRELSEGAQILGKILEPYKGKIVLLDIWGTWCGPCKAALSRSQEEYERLKDYPMVYLYLANQSPEESWKNVIKEYNVTGDNVVHYNLPDAQQQAVENYLNVNSYPTYRLFNQQGRLLDVNADPRELDGLEDLIKRLAGK